MEENFEKQSSQSLKSEIRKAEMLFAASVSLCNITFRSADLLSDLFSKMFPDSAIAQKFACKRSKTNYLIKKSLYLFCQESINKQLMNQNYVILVDESNDISDDKLLNINVRFFNHDSKNVETKLLYLEKMIDYSSEGTSKLIKDRLQKLGLSQNKMLAYIADGAHTMNGIKSGVQKKFQQDEPLLFVQICLCHCIDLAAEKASLSLIFNSEHVLKKILKAVINSSKFKQLLGEIQKELNLPLNKLRALNPTRWTGIYDSIDIVLQQWQSLTKLYTLLNDNKNQKDLDEEIENEDNILLDYLTDLNRFYLLFVYFCLEKFRRLILLFESDKIRIHWFIERPST